MMKTKIFIIAVLSLGIAGFCLAQTTSPTTSSTTTRGSNAPYTEGPVWVLTMIKTKAGLGDDYLKSIGQTVKPVYDEEKKQKIILDYKILNGDAMGPQDFSILILVQYPNMAALDSLRDKMDPIIEKVMGSEDQRRATAVKRLDIREILGTKTMREITLKEGLSEISDPLPRPGDRPKRLNAPEILDTKTKREIGRNNLFVDFLLAVALLVAAMAMTTLAGFNARSATDSLPGNCMPLAVDAAAFAMSGLSMGVLGMGCRLV